MAGVDPSIYSQVANAKASAGGTPLRDGAGLLVVKKLLVEKKHKGVMFIAEHEVLESAPVDVAEDLRTASEKATGKIAEPNKVGSEASYVVNLGNDSGPGNMKAYMLALDGSTESEIDVAQFEAMLRQACGKDQPLRGAVIRYTSFRKPIQKGKNAGAPFTAYRWEFVPQTAEQIAMRRAMLDAKAAAAQK